jgi:hypothetical protein
MKKTAAGLKRRCGRIWEILAAVLISEIEVERRTNAGHDGKQHELVVRAGRRIVAKPNRVASSDTDKLRLF